MQVKAVHRNARMAPRKMRPLATMLRGMPTVDADAQLLYTSGKAAQIMRRVIASAVANAKENHGMIEALRIKDIWVDEGMKLKRFRAGSRGMAHPYTKAMAHVTVIIEGQEAEQVKKAPAIETITADTYAALDGVEELPVEKATETPSENKEGPVRSVETKTDKATGEAFQKTKMMQQGGNKQKSFRRKSV
ncbi:MAG: 50S ribosomal protein L22 [Candidatus Andersenbacteria bacterium]|nr:50S ribosomal protein L22 [Candidatus Andersenbacteria bacterium]MBI3251046.1 50S ribosomal protein L22 [Candidatus Andersenbacteria bacterium]